MSDLIRWDETRYGSQTGHVGTLDEFAFQIWKPERASGEWVLTSSLPGMGAGRALHYGGTPDDLKPEAERLLRAFAASLGAIFPGTAAPLTADGTTCDWEIAGVVKGEPLPCTQMSRYAMERADRDPSYRAAADRAATEACPVHLADTVVALMDGDDSMPVTVRARWDA